MTTHYYIGLMSGTSLDAIDAVLIKLEASDSTFTLIATHQEPIEPHLKKRLLALTQPAHNEIDEMGELDMELGEKLAEATLHLLKKADIEASQVHAIGSHGQTIRHRPTAQRPFTLQIGNPNIIAAHTGIQTVANFRPRDMVLGGQGAPLAPAFHNALWRSTEESRWIINIGGITNLTYLSKDPENLVFGFDSGPGNCLMDSWTQTHYQKPFDKNGDWASKGEVNPRLLEQFLQDDYFKKTGPKSTGRERFNLHWIEENLDQLNEKIEAVDIQATLLELTAKTIADAIVSVIPKISGKHNPELGIYLCGGGAHNRQLVRRIEALSRQKVLSTEKLGINPDWVEAAAFAWLAHQTLEKKPGNLPAVTGARSETLLGAIYPA